MTNPPPAPVAQARMSWPKRIVAALFVLAVAGAVAASLAPRPEQPATVQAIAARQGAITRIVTAGGKLQAATQVKLSSNISGDLVELTVREGDRVTRGQLIARIEARRYQAQVNQQEAARAAAAADLQLQRVKVAQLDQDLKRVERLFASQNASQAEVDKARADLDSARALAAASEQRIAQGDAALRDARQLLAYATIVAPIDGIVTSRQKQVGERVRGSDFNEDPIVIIATLSSMEAKVEVGEQEVIFVKEGDPAEVEIDAFPERKFKAQVVEVARNATVKNAGTEQEVTTFVVRLALTDKVPGALPGMSTQASISTDTRQDAVVVPIQAVTVRPEKDVKPLAAAAEKPLPPPAAGPAAPGKKPRREPFRKVVFVVEDGVAKLRAVETGLASDTEIEITAGLKAGEQVVDGPYRVLSKELADGKKVKVEEPAKDKDKEKAKDAKEPAK